MGEPQKLPLVLSPEEVKRILAMATNPKARAMLRRLPMVVGCGPARCPGIVAGDIDSEQRIIRIVQSKGRKETCYVMLPAEVLELLR